MDTVILTHMHYDHAGALARFPKAVFHLQAAEMAYATGPCMCDAALNHPFTVQHVCEMVRHVYSGRVRFHEGDAGIAPGIEVFAAAGHSMGLQAVRVKTAAGWMVLASDASHFYENFAARKLFPIVADAPAMLRSFDRIGRMAQQAGTDRARPRSAGLPDVPAHRGRRQGGGGLSAGQGAGPGVVRVP